MTDWRKILRVALPLLFASVLLTFVMPRSAKFPYDWKKGSEWSYETLYAQFDFPVLKTDEQIRSELFRSEDEAVPYYRYSPQTVSRSLKALEDLDLGVLGSAVSSCLLQIYERGVVGDEGIEFDGLEMPDIIYIQRGKRAVKCPSVEVWRLSDARARLLEEISGIGVDCNVDSLFRAQGVYALVEPNLIYDEQTTAMVYSQSGRIPSATSGYVAAGQVIVAKGEIITAEISQILESYKQEYNANMGYSASGFLFTSGSLLVAAALVLLLLLVILTVSPVILEDSRFYYVLLVYLLAAGGGIFVAANSPERIFLLPLTLAAIYLQAFFRNKLIVSVYLVSLLPLCLFATNGAEIFVMYALAGLVAMRAFRTLGKGWKQFVVALISFAVLSASYMAFRFCDMLSGDMLRDITYIFMGCMLSVAGYPLVYLFEKIFNLVSNSRLQELCDTSGKLLRQLESNAPGTFQHSLQVMNMAEAVARRIDANPLLVRAGALYHDIGKMKNPQCFIENESLLAIADEDKYHARLSAEKSAADIIAHMTDGVELARKNSLPEVIVDFIRTHHGTTQTAFFYNKYISEGGDPAQESNFRYPGSKPRTKEQVLLMLCDSIEAGTRSLGAYSAQKYSEFVDNIVSLKMKDGQLDDSELSLCELRIFKEVIKDHLAKMHHGRIDYSGGAVKNRKQKSQIKNHESRKETN